MRKFDIKVAENEIIRFLKDLALSKLRDRKPVIGLSGGLDSSTVVLLALKVWKIEDIICVCLPTEHSSPEHMKDAQLVANLIGLPENNMYTLDISDIVTGFEKVRLNYANHLPLASGSAASRIRMIILFDLIREFNGFVLGTENLSEYLLGYFTPFGDNASTVEPINHLFKTEVRELAKHLGVPSNIILKPPSADWWPGQKDEDELGASYKEIDEILDVLQKGNWITDITKFNNQKLAGNIIKRLDNIRFKREIPYSAKKYHLKIN